MQNPLFSIVLPTYNRAYILHETVMSVLNQQFSNWELLVVDDGSTDNTKEIVLAFKDDRIKYIYQKNQERSIARNNGISNSKGEYICFLDSDDLFQDNHLMILYNFIIENNSPIALLFTNHLLFKETGLEKPEIVNLKEDAISYFLLNPVIPARVCIHKDILKDFNFQSDIVIVEDTVLWVTIANKYPVFQIPEYTITYRLHEGNSIDISNNCFFSRLQGLNKLFENKEITNKVDGDLRRGIISDTYLGIARHYEYKNSFLKMVVNLFMSFIKFPKSDKNKHKLYMVYSYVFEKRKMK